MTVTVTVLWHSDCGEISNCLVVWLRTGQAFNITAISHDVSILPYILHLFYAWQLLVLQDLWNCTRSGSANVSRDRGSMTTTTMTASCTLSDVLKLAEHGTVQEFARALTLAKLDLESTMRHHLVYDFGAAEQYLRVLIHHQRQDILEWLLDNDEIVNSVVTSLLVYACEQPSLRFFFWLQKRLTWRFQTESLIPQQFQTAMEHGSVEIASYLLTAFPAHSVRVTLKNVHANVEELWRNVYLLMLLCPQYWHRLKYWSQVLDPLIKSNDVSKLEYALNHGFLALGVELTTTYSQSTSHALASRPATVISEGVTADISSNLYSWTAYCVSCINLALELGRWKIAKMFIAVLQQVRPDDFPYGTISCFRLKHPENMSEEDMSEMIEWCMNCLRAMWKERHVKGRIGAPAMLPQVHEPQQQQRAPPAPAPAPAPVLGGGITFRRTPPVQFDQELDFACRITGTFVAACDFGVPAACDALLADETLGEVITKHLKLADKLCSSSATSQYTLRILNCALRRASTVDYLVEKGMSPLFLRKFTNIAHVHGMHPDWVRWAISDNLRPSPFQSGGETKHGGANKQDEVDNDTHRKLDKAIFAAFCDDRGNIFSSEPFVSMSEPVKFDFLKWLGKNLIGTRFANEVEYYSVVLRHPLVNATNLTDFIPSVEPICLRVLRDIFKQPLILSLRSIEDVEDIINVLLQGIAPETDLLPLNGFGPAPRPASGDGGTAPRTFAKYDEALDHLTKALSTASSVGLVRVVKAHVMRLEAKLKALEDRAAAVAPAPPVVAPVAAPPPVAPVAVATVAAVDSGASAGCVTSVGDSSSSSSSSSSSVKNKLTSSKFSFPVRMGAVATPCPQKPSATNQEQLSRRSSASPSSFSSSSSTSAPRFSFASSSTSASISSSQPSSSSSGALSQKLTTNPTSAQELRETIRRHRSLGAVLAQDVDVLDFSSAQWFLDGLSSNPDEAPKAKPLSKSARLLLLSQQKRRFRRVRHWPGGSRSELTSTVALTLPGLEILVSKTCGSNRKLFNHWRTEFGIAHTSEMYNHLVGAQLFSEPFRINGPMRVSLRAAEREIRVTTAAIAGVYCELGCDAPDTDGGAKSNEYPLLETLDHVHEWLCEYCDGESRHDSSFQPMPINALQVTSLDIAVMSLLEAVDAWCNSVRINL